MQDNNSIKLCNDEWVYCDGNCSNCMWQFKVVISPIKELKEIQKLPLYSVFEINDYKTSKSELEETGKWKLKSQSK